MHECPAMAPSGVFRYARVESPSDLPAPDPKTIDLALLDMNHGWPNLGHDSIVHIVREAGCDLSQMLEGTGLSIRLISFDVRERGMLPEPPGGRFALYIGTGGPGHPDPRLNDGVQEYSQGIVEDASWEGPLFSLFEAILADDQAALLAVCHTFELLCRWSGTAHAALRGPEKGGKSAGVLENILTPEARCHPWFARFAADLPDGERLRIIDSRLFDMIPNGMPRWVTPLAHETRAIGGPPGDAITMVEMARDGAGVMPRVFAVNHHPEIVSRERSRLVLEQKFAAGHVTRAWYEERARALTQAYPAEDSERLLHLTSDYTLVGPLQFHLHRRVRLRAEALGLRIKLHENDVQDRRANATHGSIGRLEGAGVLSE